MWGAFEFSTVDATLTEPVGSVFNPKAGIIRVPEIGSLICDPEQVDPAATKIECPKIGRRLTKPDWESVL